MGWWDALWDAMRTRWTGRIGLTEADRLVTGDRPDPDYLGLGVLLDAAKAPASAEELAGEGAAVAGLLAAYRSAVPTTMPTRRRRVRVSLSARMVVVKVAAGVGVLAVGGTAVAAETGKLPAAAQQRAHNAFAAVGVPAPTADARPTGSDPGGVAGSVRPSADPTPTSGVASLDPSGPVALGLCQAWDAAQADPQGKAMTAESRRILSAAAGGEASVPSFCAKLLADHQTAGTPATHPGAATATPSHPGGGNGNGRGNGRAHPTPSAHH